MDSSYSLEATLLQSTRFCEVWIYDSTKGDSAKSQIPRSLRHRAHFAKVALGASDRHGAGDDPKTWTLKSLMTENGTVFLPPAFHVFSNADNARVAGHSHIDFLRMDVEGWEWETFRGIIRDFTLERMTPPQGAGAGGVDGDAPAAAAGQWAVHEREGVLPFGQLQIELHVWNQRFQDFLEWWQLLEASGLRPFHNEVWPASGF